MKRFEDFTKEELWALRKEIVLGSIYFTDYRNSMGIDKHSAHSFFDGYLDYLMENDGELFGGDYGLTIDKCDNAEELWSWFNCFDDFSWVEYDN